MRISLYALGGTISMDGPAGDGVAVRLTGADLLDTVPGLADTGLDVAVADVRAVPSACLTLDDMVRIADQAEGAVTDGADGVVVVQGTDTIEETAYLLHRLWRHDAPIVVTGAMRNPTLAGADGPANLLAAMRVAAAPDARGRGCLVVFNDEVHSARWVRKTHSTSTATFVSPETGPVGYLIEGSPTMLIPPQPRPILPRSVAQLPAVALYTLTLDDDGGLLDGLAERYAGLVVAGFGVGHVPDWIAPRLGELAEQIPVVLTTRTGSGPVLRATYGSIGSESDLLRRGLIAGGLLHPYKARILLRLLLAEGADRGRIAAAFDAA